MSLHHIHDFYIVESILTNIRMRTSLDHRLEFKHSVARLRADAEEYERTVFPNMAKRIFMYIWAACLGEARHSSGAECRNKFVPEIKQRDRHYLFEHAADFPPTPNNIETLIEIFSQKWGSGFGGKAWQTIAEALKMYFTETPTFFIDHVVDLEHNNGTVFSKSDSINTIFFDVGYPSFSSFLNFKFSNDITEVHRDNLQVTYRVHQMLKRYITLFGVESDAVTIPVLHELDDYEIEWGAEKITLDKKWRNFVDVRKSNVPKAHDAWDEVKVPAPAKFTEKEFKKHLNLEIKRVLSKYPLSKGEKTKFNKYAKSTLQHYAGSFKTPKAKKTYNVLPAKFYATSGAVKISTPVCEFTIANQLCLQSGRGHIFKRNGCVFIQNKDTAPILFNSEKLEVYLD